MISELRQTGYVTALVRQFFATGLYNSSFEDAFLPIRFVASEGKILKNLREWISHLARRSPLQIYFVIGGDSHDYRLATNEPLFEKTGIVVENKDGYSLWVPCWEFNHHIKDWIYTYRENTEFMTTGTRREPGFVCRDGNILSDNAIDNRKELLSALRRITAFAKKFDDPEADRFAGYFEIAASCVSGKRKIDYEDAEKSGFIKEELSRSMFYHPDAESLLNGIACAWVFEDSDDRLWPKTGKRISKKNDSFDEYEKLTVTLYRELLNAIIFCFNKLDLYTTNGEPCPFIQPVSPNWVQQGIHAFQNLTFPHNTLANIEVYRTLLNLDRIYILLHRKKIDRLRLLGEPFPGYANDEPSLFAFSDPVIAHKWEMDVPDDAGCIGIVDHRGFAAMCAQGMDCGIKTVLIDGPELFLALPVMEIVRHEIGIHRGSFIPTNSGDPSRPLGRCTLANAGMPRRLFASIVLFFDKIFAATRRG